MMSGFVGMGASAGTLPSMIARALAALAAEDFFFAFVACAFCFAAFAAGSMPNSTPVTQLDARAATTARGGTLAATGVVCLISNATSAPAETIAVQFLPRAAARRIDMPRPDDCPA